MSRPKLRSLLALIALFALAVACQPGPEEDYANYRKRTEKFRELDAQIVEIESQLSDIRGRWLLNASLNGGFTLGLWVVIDELEGVPFEAPTEGARLRARLWLDDQDPREDPALVETELTLDEEGRFELVADPLSLSPDVLGTVDPVDARVRLQSQSRNGDLFCGTVLGSVTSPLELNLDGSNFAAVRDDEGTLTIDEIPFQCPPLGGGPVQPIDMGTGDNVVSDMTLRPEAPAIEGESVPGELSGHWYLNAKLRGALPLQLWVSLVQSSAAGEAGSIDGAIRRGVDPVAAPALATFSAPLDREGRFEIWLPNFSLETETAEILGDILLAAITLPSESEGDPTPAFCGGAAGEVSKPIPLDLEGTTFYALRWTPGEPAPEEIPAACPNE